MPQKKDVGDGISSEPGLWTFSGDVAKAFDKHVKASVPGYEWIHRLAVYFSQYFVFPTGRYLDIGCSTGSLLETMAVFLGDNKEIYLRGIDPEKDMIEFARQRLSQASFDNVELEAIGVLEDGTSEYDYITSILVAQFVHPRVRQQYFNIIYEKLNWGGCLFLCEKVLGSDGRFSDLLANWYQDFKIDQGFTLEEADAKTRSIRGVMRPFSEAGNLSFLQRAGFSDIECVFRLGNFAAYLAIK